LHHKKISYDGTVTENDDDHHLVIVDDSGSIVSDEEEKGLFDEYYCEKNEGGWKRYFSYYNTDSYAWILLQVGWRVMVSFGFALLVFYIATKPPPPKFSLEVST
jgi:hypothetical protein